MTWVLEVVDTIRKARASGEAGQFPARAYSAAEGELLREAANGGAFEVWQVDQSPGPWVRVGRRDFQDSNDPSVAAKYRQAFHGLASRGLLDYEGGSRFVLTVEGFVRARRLIDSSPRLVESRALGAGLLPQEAALLRMLVEAYNRYLPKRMPFHLMSLADGQDDDALFHEGLPEQKGRVYRGDIDSLAELGLVRLRSTPYSVEIEITARGLTFEPGPHPASSPVSGAASALAHLRSLIAEAPLVAPSIVNFEQGQVYGRVTDEKLDYKRFLAWVLESQRAVRTLSEAQGGEFTDLLNALAAERGADVGGPGLSRNHSRSILVHKIMLILMASEQLLGIEFEGMSLDQNQQTAPRTGGPARLGHTLRIMISSTIEDLKEERASAEEAIRGFHFERYRSEVMPSIAQPPADVCDRMARDCDAMVLILGGRYGWIIPEKGISVTEQEFDSARDRDRGKILVFEKSVETREPSQVKFVNRVKSFADGYFVAAPFNTPDELKAQVQQALSGWVSERVTRHEL